MDLKVYINFIKFMAYNIKYQQKAYIIIKCKYFIPFLVKWSDNTEFINTCLRLNQAFNLSWVQYRPH